jgi:hypothetical protein
MERLGKLRDFYKRDPETKANSDVEDKGEQCLTCRNSSFYMFWELRICTYCSDVYMKKE